MSEDCDAQTICGCCALACFGCIGCARCLINRDNKCVPYQTHVGCLTLALAGTGLPCMMLCPLDAWGRLVTVDGHDGKYFVSRKNFNTCCVSEPPTMKGYMLVRTKKKKVPDEPSSAAEFDMQLGAPLLVNSQQDDVVRIGTRAYR